MAQDKMSGVIARLLEKEFRVNPDRAFKQYDSMTDEEKSRVKLAMAPAFEKEFFIEMDRPTMSQGYVNPAGTEAGDSERRMRQMAEGEATPMDYIDMATGILAATGGKIAKRSGVKKMAAMKSGPTLTETNRQAKKTAVQNRRDTAKEADKSRASEARAAAASAMSREEWERRRSMNFRGEIDKDHIDETIRLKKKIEALKDEMRAAGIEAPGSREENITFNPLASQNFIKNMPKHKILPEHRMSQELNQTRIHARDLENTLQGLPPEKIESARQKLHHDIINAEMFQSMMPEIMKATNMKEGTPEADAFIAEKKASFNLGDDLISEAKRPQYEAAKRMLEKLTKGK